MWLILGAFAMGFTLLSSTPLRFSPYFSCRSLQINLRINLDGTRPAHAAKSAETGRAAEDTLS